MDCQNNSTADDDGNDIDEFKDCLLVFAIIPNN